MANSLQSDTYADMLYKSHLSAISIQQADAIVNGPLCYPQPLGLTKATCDLLRKNSILVASHAAELWIQIDKIKKFVAKRNDINEKCMFTEQEINYLLRVTNDLHEMIDHISSQEHIFMDLGNDTTQNIYDLFRTYIDKTNKSHDIIYSILDAVIKDLNLPYTQKGEHEIDAINSIASSNLEYFIESQNLQTTLGVDTYGFADNHLQKSEYYDFILFQVWLILIYRHACASVLGNSATLDAKQAMQALIKHRELSRKLLDAEHLDQSLGIEDFKKVKDMEKNLAEGLQINHEFEAKLDSDLDKLVAMSKSRKPREEQAE